MSESTSLRERKKAATRAAIQEQAMRLFLEKGYEATTVEEISAAAGVSHMTFFRYFPTKEDVVLADEYDPFIAAAITERPTAEPAVLKVRRALRESVSRVGPEERELVLIRARLILRTPALRSRLWAQERDTAGLIEDALLKSDSAGDRLRLQVVASTCAAALSTVVVIWVEEDGERDLVEIFDEVFAVLFQEFGRHDD